MRFTKMHGLGNDYVYIDAINQDLSNISLPELSKLVSDRHFGVGSDGIILIFPSEVADFRMRIFNPDGSEAEMCGNGVRCFAKYVFEHGLTDKTSIDVETGAGIIHTQLLVDNERVKGVRVDMGQPRLKPVDIPFLWEPNDEPAVDVPIELPDGQRLHITAVSMGNPHCVVFVDDAENFPVAEIGPIIENHRLFPNRTNVEFATVIDRRHIRMRVWERGAGETMACGTGACATAVAAALSGRADRHVTVHLNGGDLEIQWAADNRIYMTGPAAEVFSGELSAEFLESLKQVASAD